MPDLVPAKRGENTPVPADVETKKVERAAGSQPDDLLIPKSYLEQRAEERQSRGHTYAELYDVAKGDGKADAVSNPVPRTAAQPLSATNPMTVNPMAAPAPVMSGHAVPGYAAPNHSVPNHAEPHYAVQGYSIPGTYADFAPGGQLAHAVHYAQPRYAQPPFWQPPFWQPQYGQYQYAQPGFTPHYVPPQEPWKPGQRAAALWGSFFQHTIFAIAVQIFLYGSLFLLLAATSWQDAEGIFIDDVPTTLTDFMVWLAKPEHLLLSFVLVLIVVGALFVTAYYTGAGWQRAKGLQGRAKSFWLTTITGGSISFFTFAIFSPITLFAWLIIGLLFGAGGNAGLWASTFIFILLGAVINGFVCMGFGRLFLSKARPPIDFAKLAAEAEARARAQDEQALAGEPAEERFRIHGT